MAALQNSKPQPGRDRRRHRRTENALVFPRDAVPSSVVAEYVESHRGQLLAMLERSEAAGVTFAREYARVMDRLLASLFQAALVSVGAEGAFPVVLGAVGGYGRGLLGWKSDLDVRLVTDENSECAQRLAEALLYPLWDAGVNIGHQVSSASDLIEGARDDLPTATSVLDFRVLAGDSSLDKVLHERAFTGIFSAGELPAFMKRLEHEISERHKRFGDSIYLLEPDVKSGAGGLRDLDIALWAARARFGAAGVERLTAVGVLSGAEARELKAAENFLWTLRNHLHRRANRRMDRLTFEDQEQLCTVLGYRPLLDSIADDEDSVLGATVEALMSDYYRHARVVLRLGEQIMARAMPPPRRRRAHIVDLDNGVQLFNGQVTLTRVNDLHQEPALAFRLYTEAVARGSTLLPFARDVLIRATSLPEFCEALRRSPEAARLFVSLVATRQRAAFRNGSILAELHDTGLLTAVIPEFLPVVGRVHHDIYHVYTVDVHSVAAVDFLRALARGEFGDDHPLASSLAAEVRRPEVLYMATLLHDVGKALGGRDHSLHGAKLGAEILARLGFAKEDIEDACNLVLQHLVMYRVAARRDLEDPATVSEFARLVRNREGLQHLFLLTVADLSTTSPTSMTKWKRHMLDELFLLTDQNLAGNSGGDAARLVGVRAAVRTHWDTTEDPAFLEEYLSSMPHGYLLSNAPDEIAAHARVAFHAKERVVTAAVAPCRGSEITALCVATGSRLTDPLCVVAGDRPGLLACIAAVITANGFDVHAAQIHTRHLSNGRVQAVDLFWITARTRIAEDLGDALEMLRQDLEKVITGVITPADLLKSRRSGRFSDRPAPAVTTEVIVDHRASATHTVIEVVTKDRPGLLFTLAKTLHELGLTIGVAKINTEGARVLDAFYVNELDGRKLDESARGESVRAALLAALYGSRSAPSSANLGRSMTRSLRP